MAGLQHGKKNKTNFGGGGGHPALAEEKTTGRRKRKEKKEEKKRSGWPLTKEEKEREEKLRLVRHGFDISRILSDTLLMCDSPARGVGEGWGVKVMRRMDRGIEGAFRGKGWEKWMELLNILF